MSDNTPVLKTYRIEDKYDIRPTKLFKIAIYYFIGVGIYLAFNYDSIIEDLFGLYK